MMKKTYKAITKCRDLVYVFLVTLIFVLALGLVATSMSFGGLRAFIVESGSMSPALPTGSITFTYPQAKYKVGDIITYKSTNKKTSYPGAYITHRIVEINSEVEKTWITTKGDANEEKDGEKVSIESVVGKEILFIPFIGYLVGYSREPVGFLLLIIFPALLVIVFESVNIVKEVREIERRKMGFQALGQIKLK